MKYVTPLLYKNTTSTVRSKFCHAILNVYELCHDATDSAFFRFLSRRCDVDVRTKRGRKVYNVRVYNFDGAQMPSIPHAHTWG